MAARAELLYAVGRPLLAWRDARWAIDCNPDSAVAYLVRGKLALEIESAVEALDDFDRALDIAPNSGAVLAWRGRAQQLLGDREAAHRDWRDAEALLPVGHEALALIAEWRSSE